MINDLLTRRQGEILQLVLEGEGVKEMSAKLGVSESAIKCHLTAVYKKHEVDGQRKLMAKYIVMYKRQIEAMGLRGGNS